MQNQFCPYCGNPLVQGEAFCRKCGASFVQQPAPGIQPMQGNNQYNPNQYGQPYPQNIPMPPKKKKLAPLLISIGAALVIVVVALVIILNNVFPSYEKVGQDYAYAYIEGDVKGILDLLPKGVVDKLLRLYSDSGFNFGEKITKDDLIEILKEEFKTGKKATDFRILSEERADSDYVEDWLTDKYALKVQEAIELKTEVSYVESDGDSDYEILYITLIKVDGRWFVSPESIF